VRTSCAVGEGGNALSTFCLLKFVAEAVGVPPRNYNKDRPLGTIEREYEW